MTEATENMDDVTEEMDQAPDELTVLKERAKTLGLKVSPNIGLETLRERVREHLSSQKDATEEEAPKDGKAKSAAQLRRELRKEQLKLVRVRVANLNPNKKELYGELVTVGNSILGPVTKFVPFGEATDDGYHIPYIIYKHLKARKFLQLRRRKNPKNPAVDVVDQRWVPEFALEVLPALTPAELADLKAQQQASAGLG